MKGNLDNNSKRKIKNLRHWDWSARNLGIKPYTFKLAAEYTQDLIDRQIITIPKSPDGVRLKLELHNQTFSRESLSLVVSLLK